MEKAAVCCCICRHSRRRADSALPTHEILFLRHRKNMLRSSGQALQLVVRQASLGHFAEALGSTGWNAQHSRYGPVVLLLFCRVDETALQIDLSSIQRCTDVHSVSLGYTGAWEVTGYQNTLQSHHHTQRAQHSWEHRRTMTR